MARHANLRMATTGLWLSLLLGCSQRAQTINSGVLTSAPPTPVQLASTAQPPLTGSPYHPRPMPPPAPRGSEATLPRTADPVLPAVSPPTAEPGPTAVTAQAAPAPPEGPPVAEALLCLLNKRPEDARRWLERCEPSNRDLLRGLLVLAVRLTEEPLPRANPQDVAAMLTALEELQEPLRPRAALTIGTMRFCKWIEKYGDYDPLSDSHQFRAGDLVQVYVELRNFTSERQGPVHLTRLASRIDIHDANQALVWRQDCDDQQRAERSHTPRREYFRNYRFYVPENMPPGLYTLRIHVTDVPTGRTARGSLDLRVTTVAGRGH